MVRVTREEMQEAQRALHETIKQQESDPYYNHELRKAIELHDTPKKAAIPSYGGLIFFCAVMIIIGIFLLDIEFLGL
jgi:hypothetical protein